MTERPPDLAALYAKHRDALHRVAASKLRSYGREGHANDVVQDAIVSIMSSPPKSTVQNWEAFLIRVVQRKALDHLKSAAVKNSGPELSEEHDYADSTDLSDEVASALERQQLAKRINEALSSLDERHRKVAWEFVALERPRNEVAAELGVTPGRVSQMKLEALAKLREAMGWEEVKG